MSRVIEIALSPPYGDDDEEKFYSEDQVRDEHGRWTNGGALHDVAHGDKVPVNPETIRAFKRELKTMLDESGYKGKVIVKEMNGPRRVVGRFVGREAGYYEPKTRVITFYLNAAGDSREEMRGTVAHEIQHAKWDLVRAAELQEMLGMRQGNTFEKLITMPSMNGRLSKSDGVTDYSRSWWERSRSGMRNVAVNETLAEIANLRASTGKMPRLAPEWAKLYRGSEAAYKMLTRRK